MTSVKLYSYFRSSASYRVRIALYWKSIEFEYIPVHLLNEGGQQKQPEFKKLNPLGEVPCLVHGDKVLGQSMAILQYLDSVWPDPSLFPKDPFAKAKVIQLCEVVNCGIHPLQNLKVLQEIVGRWGVTPEGKVDWAAHWIRQGFVGLESLLIETAGRHAFGDTLTAADLFIVPQVFNARRFQVDMSSFPTIEKVEKEALQLEAFRRSLPSAQPDAESP